MNFNQFLSVGKDPMSLISNYLSGIDLYNLSCTSKTIKRSFILNRYFKIIRTDICTLDFFKLYNSNLMQFCKHYCSEVNDYLKSDSKYECFAKLNYQDSACHKNNPCDYRHIFDPNTYKRIYELFKRSSGPCPYKTKKLTDIFEKKIQIDKFLKEKVYKFDLDRQLTRAFAEDNLKTMQIWIEAGAKEIKVYNIPKRYDKVFFMKVAYLMRAGLIKKEDFFLHSIIKHGAPPKIIKKLLELGFRADGVCSNYLKESKYRLEILPLLLEAGFCSRDVETLQVCTYHSKNWHVQMDEGLKLLLQAGSGAHQKLFNICVSKNFPKELIFLALALAKEMEDKSNELRAVQKLLQFCISGDIEEFKQSFGLI